MKLIVISSPGELAGEAEKINHLFAAGLEYFHLRKPDAPVTYIEKLLPQIHPAYFQRLVLSYCHQELARTMGVTRLHFPEHVRVRTKPREWTEYIEKGYRLSTSVHDVATLVRLPAIFEYTFLSPVFSSISKPGYQPVLPPDFKLTDHQPVPVIALGGIDPENIKKIKNMGFAGAAVLGTIWSQPEKVLVQFDKIKTICSQFAPTY